MLLYFNLLLCLYMMVKVFEERKYFQYSFLEFQFKFHTTMAFNSVGILRRGIQRIKYEDNTCYDNIAIFYDHKNLQPRSQAYGYRKTLVNKMSLGCNFKIPTDLLYVDLVRHRKWIQKKCLKLILRMLLLRESIAHIIQ